MTVATETAMERRRMIGLAMGAVACAASAPMVVLQGSVPATYASTGVVAVPLMVLLAGAAVGLLSVPYVAMSRRVPHAAVYYATISRGLGRPAGVAAGMLALLGYNTIQTSLYGLVGSELAGVFGFPWWVGALLVVPVVAVFGLVGVARLTTALGVVLVLSLIMVAFFVSAAFDVAPEGINVQGFDPAGLTGGLGGALAYVLASLMGFEAAASFSEEARKRRAPGRAVGAALVFLILLYTIVAWAVGLAVGPSQVTAGFPDTLAVFDASYGPLMPPYVRFVFVLAIVASMVALHSFAARYAYAMARDGVLPPIVAATGLRKADRFGTGAPAGGSLLQTGIAVLVIVVFAVLGTDPLASLFAYFSTLGALALLCLLLLCAAAAWRYLPAKGPDRASFLVRRVAPGLGVPAGLWIVYQMATNVEALLGTGPGSVVPIVIVAVVPVVFFLGLLWAAHLRQSQTHVYDQIGEGQASVYTVPDGRLGQYEI